MKTVCLLTSLFLLAACQPARQTASHRHTASERVATEACHLYSQPIPASRASLAIPLQSGRIPALPSPATYHARQGRASVHAETRRDTLWIYADCDSLQRIIYGYEQRFARLNEQQEQSREKRKSVPLWKWIALAAGLVCLLRLVSGQRRT